MKEIEGFVVVEFTVRENGTVSNPMVVSSEPDILFDDAALHAVARFKFKL
jgi:protein TonB